MDFIYVKALHIIFVVSWFSGLFYIVRLFIYHTEAQTKPEDTRLVLQAQFQVMEKKLWYIITWPAAVLTTLFGWWMIALNPALLQASWMQVKLGLTALLWTYHLFNHMIYLRYQRNEIRWSSAQLRLWNELATLWLVSIVFVVIAKSAMDWISGTVGFFLVAVLLMIAVKIYKYVRKS